MPPSVASLGPTSPTSTAPTARWARGVWALLVGAATASSAPGASAQAVCTAGLHKNWGFAAGTPLNEPPARSPVSGQITVATQGGYLHALSWEGAFLWSYSTEGGLLSGVHAVGDGRLVAISSSRQVYSWHSNGQLQWSFRSPVTPSEVVVSDPRQLVFFVSGTRLFALTARGTLSWSAELDSPAASNLAIDAMGSAWVITRDDRLHRVRTPYFHDSWALGAAGLPALGGGADVTAGSATAPRLVLALPEGAVILRGEVLSHVGSDGTLRWQHAGIAHAASAVPAPHAKPQPTANIVALDHAAGAAWMSAQTGETLSRIGLDSIETGASDLALAASGTHLALGDARGTLWVYNQRGQSAHCTISFATVLAPVFDTEHRQIIAAAGDGSVAALGFDGEW